jgi:glycosyltransferase involved in cell wall biosynthesis
MAPTVSIVIPTRDRPDKLARLLLRVKKQLYQDFECLVIDDGSSDDTLDKYDIIWNTLDDRFVLKRKGKSERGGGPGKTRNTGIRLSHGDFIAFCDDDDLWIRDDHLSEAVAALTKYEADLFIANMQLSNDGNVINPDWFSIGARYLWKNPVSPKHDIYLVTREDIGRFLLHGSIHANTLVVNKALMTKAGMYYEREIFGEDYDITFRLADNANKILIRSAVVADLDVTDHPSFIRSYEAQELMLFVILASLRAETQVADAGLRRVARSNRAWFILELARRMLAEGRCKQARELAVQSILLRPTMAAIRTIARTIVER